MFDKDWPPDYNKIYNNRITMIGKMLADHGLVVGAKEHYKHCPVDFINHWCDTYDPRVTPATKPFVLFGRQQELIEYLCQLLKYQESGLIQKSRDMGVTWTCGAFSVHGFLFRDGFTVGWGSRDQDMVDKIGDLDSIFEKLRMLLRGIPRFFLPEQFDLEKNMSFTKITQRYSNNMITGDCGDNIGRGGRTSMYFKDEASFFKRPEKIEAALGDNTNVQVDLSSISEPGSVFHRKRESGVDWEGQIIRKRVNVFITSWRDHPMKDQEWYDARREKAEREGLLHIFAREVDMDWSASIEGVCIPLIWIEAAVDAHKKIPGFDDYSNNWIGALDVADGGLDANALVFRQGLILRELYLWGNSPDVGASARKVIDYANGRDVEINYDCVGIGAGVKAEANRLKSESLAKNIKWVAWNAGAAPKDKDKRLIKGDRQSPTNGEQFANLKAQSWWRCRRRFEKTYKVIKKGEQYPLDELISIDSGIANKGTLIKELGQPNFGTSSSSLKMIVNKTPEGTKSPNSGDAVVMDYNPISKGYSLENI